MKMEAGPSNSKSTILSSNKQLWFEYLFNPDLLQEVFDEPNCNSILGELLLKFLTSSVEPFVIEKPPQNTETEIDVELVQVNHARKQKSMKVLSLKIAAFWKWDLLMLESMLPLQLQYVLMRDLLCFTNDKPEQSTASPHSHHNLKFELLSDLQVFSVLLYHRWILHLVVSSSSLSKRLLLSATPNVESADEIMSRVMDGESRSESIIRNIAALKREYIAFPTADSFSWPIVEKEEPDQSRSIRISATRYNCQIYYEFGVYKLFRQFGDYNESFIKCEELLKILKSDPNEIQTDGYCEIDENRVHGIVNGSIKDTGLSLLHSFYLCCKNGYQDVVTILQRDNITKEIPMSFRNALELDLISALSLNRFTANRDLLLQIQTLNTVRRMAEGASYPAIDDFLNKWNSSRRKSDVLAKALKPLLSIDEEEGKKQIRMFFLMLHDKCGDLLIKEIATNRDINYLFSEEELKNRTQDKALDLPEFTKRENEIDNRIKSFGNSRLLKCRLEEQIMKSYDPLVLQSLIGKFISRNPMKPVCTISRKWEMLIPLQNIVMKLPNTFVQQYSFVLLAKVIELTESQSYTNGLNLLRVVEEEVQKQGNSGVCHKLCQFIMWEQLYLNMLDLELKWQSKQIANGSSLSQRCKQCLSLMNSSDVGGSPRLDILEQCIVTLLNLSEWDYLATTEWKNHFGYLEMSVAIALSCIDAVKFKGTKKLGKDVWQLTLPVFTTGNQKRPGSCDRENVSPGTPTRAVLTQYLLKLREPTAINVVLSLLVRLYNIIRDEPPKELFLPYAQLWPLSIPNTGIYSLTAVYEVIYDVVSNALKYHPYNVLWLKLLGDLNYVTDHHSTSIKFYLEAMSTSSDYYVRPLSKTVIEDYVYRRMVECCIALQCFTQAAVLTQFSDPVDYTTAFKCLSEAFSSDAMDSYYSCIWDTNILEYLVYMLTKRGEQYRKQNVMNAIGSLELNANNNEEIKREATNMRKFKFLRAMTKQFVC